MDNIDNYKKTKAYFTSFLKNDKDTYTKDEVMEILHSMHGRHLGRVIDIMLQNVKLEEKISKWKQEHERSLALLIENESQKIQLEKLNKELNEKTEKLNNLLKEKDILLKEMNHRAKNNFQIISNIIALAANNIEDKNVLDIFDVCQNRIRVMTLLHEKLYKLDKIDEINIKIYINEIVNELITSFGLNENKYKVTISSEDIFLETKKTIYCGLIINELVTNALKYAFPKDLFDSGEIIINITEKENNIVELSIKDSGIGISGELHPDSLDSLGLQLVFLLSENQLNGQVDYNKENGTEFKITFEK